MVCNISDTDSQIEVDFSFQACRVLPTEVGLLSEATSLSLSFNNLQSLPTQLGKLTRLVDLDLRANELTSLPEQIYQLKELSYLDLGFNKVEYLSSGLGKLTALEKLDLRKNGLGCLPSQVGRLRMLRELWLDSSNLTHLPTQVGMLTELRKLRLNSSQLMEIPSQVGKLQELNSFDLDFNNIAEIPTEFGLMSGLDYLYLKSNELFELPTEMGLIEELDEFDLMDNHLGALPIQLGKLTELDYLDVRSNKLRTVPTELGNLIMLDNLYLSGNRIREVPSEILGLSVMTTLSIDVNPPNNLVVETVRSHDIVLSWSAPRIPSTHKVVQYDLTVKNSKLGIADETSISNQKTIRVNALYPKERSVSDRMKFTIKVQATVKDEFNKTHHTMWSEPLEVTTCRTFMQRDNTLNVSHCYAVVGYYKATGGEAKSCTDLERKLSPGAIHSSKCLEGEGLAVADLPVSIYFWRPSVLSEDIKRCPKPMYCTHQREFGQEKPWTPDQYCAENRTGIYCANCTSGYVLGASSCKYCTEAAKSSHMPLVIFICAFLFLLFSLYLYVLLEAGILQEVLCQRMNLNEAEKDRRTRWKERLTLLNRASTTKVRIIFGYFQVLSSYERTYLRQSLVDSTQFLDLLNLFSNLDLTWLFESAIVRCAYDFTHYDTLVLVTVAPLVLAVLLFVWTVATARCWLPRLLGVVIQHYVSTILLLLFVIYPYVSQTILSTFWCEEFQDTDHQGDLTTSALRVDYRLSCEMDVYPFRHAFEMYAAFMIVIYPIGVIVLYLALLFAERGRLLALSHLSPNEKSREFSKIFFLIKPYRTNRFWFEAYELARKLLQTSLVGFFANSDLAENYPRFKALFSLNLTVVFILALAIISPYNQASDFAFALISMLLLLPAAQVGILDPFGLREDVSPNWLQWLALTEIVVFLTSIVVDLIILKIQKTSRLGNLVGSATRKRGPAENRVEDEAHLTPTTAARFEEVPSTDKGEQTISTTEEIRIGRKQVKEEVRQADQDALILAKINELPKQKPLG